MLVRPLAVETDLPELRALWRATWRDTYGPVLGAGRLHLVDEALAEPAVRTMFAPDGGGFVGVLDGAVVGSVCFAERRGTGYLWGMYVHPAHQRRGCGSRLLLFAADAVGGATRLELRATTAASAAFYRRLGFGEAGASDFELFPGVTCAATRFDAPAAVLRAGRASLSPPA